MTSDNLMRRLKGLDPVKAGELDGAAEAAEGSDLLARILAVDPESAGNPLDAGDGLGRPEGDGRRSRWLPTAPKLALGVAAAAAMAAAVILVVLIGQPSGGSGSGGSGGNRLAAALDGAATAAASSPRPAVDQSYTYLKTREMSVNTTAANQRSWKVFQSTTREEWVTGDGSGRLRIVAGPSHFVDSGDRAEWEGAGRPNFLLLGFGKRTEERWLAEGMLRGGVEELPTDPDALAARLREEAGAGDGEIPVPAATLQLIAEDLRDPVSSPALRQALYKAAKRVPGISYLGTETDPEGRTGTAIGVTGFGPGGPTRYSLIFDPATSEVLATEITAPAPSGPGDPEGPALRQATVYVESQKVDELPKSEGGWLNGFEFSAS